MDCQRLFGLRENLKQFIITEEVESCELPSFVLQICEQRFLDVVQCVIAINYSFEELWNLINNPNNILNITTFIDNDLPVCVDTFKAFALFDQLLGDVRGFEDWLKIHPINLKLNPFLNQIRNLLQCTKPIHYLFFKGLFKRRE